MSIDWDKWTAIGTLLLACVTGGLAFVTTLATKEGRKEFQKNQEMAERHHRDGKRPIVVLVPFKGHESKLGPGFLRIEGSYSRGIALQEAPLELQSSVCNIGSGPAINITIDLRFPTEDIISQTRHLKPLGNMSDNNLSKISFKCELNPPITSTNLQAKLNSRWEIEIKYEDIYGFPHKTIHKYDGKTLQATL